MIPPLSGSTPKYRSLVAAPVDSPWVVAYVDRGLDFSHEVAGVWTVSARVGTYLFIGAYLYLTIQGGLEELEDLITGLLLNHTPNP